jgi:G3E family GTPase
VVVPDEPIASDARRPGPPLPLTVLTGFLGAGKTSLLNRLLKDPALAGTAVLINEFGEIGLDHLLVEKISDDLVLLPSGCVCCTMRGDLIDALERLLRDLDNRRANLTRVVLETTGLADPAPVLHTVMVHPYLVMRYRLDGVVTVVDAINGLATIEQHPEAMKQIAAADRLALAKSDLLNTPERRGVADELRVRLKRLNPAAPILDVAAGEASATRLINCGLYDPDSKVPDVRRWLPRRPTRPRTRMDIIITARSASARSRSRPTGHFPPPRSTCFSIFCAGCTGRTCCASRAS